MAGEVTRSPVSYPAITLWQPWASLVALGAKRFEFRSWRAQPKYWGQRIAIHAATRPVNLREVKFLLVNPDRTMPQQGLDRNIAEPLLVRLLQAPRSVPFGHVLCLATLGEPVGGAELCERLGVPWPLSEHGLPTNWGWPLTDIAPVTPIAPARGAQGWWRWTPAKEEC